MKKKVFTTIFLLYLIPLFCSWLIISLAIILFLPKTSGAEEKWVQSIETSTNWAVFPCTNYLITVACGIEKDFSDPGSLPQTISVGDTIQYKDKKGKMHDFHVKAINYFMYEKDVDFVYGGQRYTAKKGETMCNLYNSKKARISEDYLSKIVIKDCRFISGSAEYLSEKEIMEKATKEVQVDENSDEYYRQIGAIAFTKGWFQGAKGAGEKWHHVASGVYDNEIFVNLEMHPRGNGVFGMFSKAEVSEQPVWIIDWHIDCKNNKIEFAKAYEYVAHIIKYRTKNYYNKYEGLKYGFNEEGVAPIKTISEFLCMFYESE